MPRWALLLLLLAFIVPGLYGHELWPPDGPGFGRIWSMAQGGISDWLLPNVAGAQAPQGGPLPFWVGAVLVRLLGGVIGDGNAAASTNLLWYGLAVVCLWMAAHRLARRDQAQPVAGAFGGEASRQDYARLIADVSVLLMIGTLGLILRLHQIQSDGAILAIVALAVLAASLVEWRLLPAALLAGCSSGALALTLGPLSACALLLGSLLVFWRAQSGAGIGVRAMSAASALMLVSAVLVAGAWPLTAFVLLPREAGSYFEAWGTAMAAGLPTIEDLLWLVRNGAWFLWPLWPLACWAAYAWRSSLHTPHLERPLALLGALALAALFSLPLDERVLVTMIPPLVVLAAYGATTLRRALDNLLDWFAIATFSLCLVFFWAYYVAMEAGAPKAMAASIARLAPGFAPAVHLLPLAVAACAAAAWIQLVAWRILRRPRVLWRGPMLAAAGVTFVWINVNLLFLPAVDYVFSYRRFAQEVSAQLRALGVAHGCVQAHRIPLAERALLAYYGKLRFDRDGSAETCRFALHRDSRRSMLDNDPPPGVHGMWELAWESHRQARPDERWRIWVRAQ